MSTQLIPPPGALVYHRPTRQYCIVTAVHRTVQPPRFSVYNPDQFVEHHDVALDQLDLWRDEYPDTTYIWRDLRPGMTIMWCRWPDVLDVTAVSEPDDQGMCVIDAVQGRVSNAACDSFHLVTRGLSDVIDTIILEEGERVR